MAISQHLSYPHKGLHGGFYIIDILNASCIIATAGSRAMYLRPNYTSDWGFMYIDIIFMILYVLMKSTFIFFWIPFVVAIVGFFIKGCH